MNKKKIFAIVIFVVLGLFMYTFANPLEEDISESANQTSTNDQTNETKEEVAVPVAENATQETVSESTTRTPLQTRPTNNTSRQTNINTNTQTNTNTNNNQEETSAVEEQTKPEEKKQEENNSQEEIVDLTQDKLNAIKELSDYKKDYVFSNEDDYKKVVDEYTKKINDSTTLDEINKNLDEGKAKIDELISDDLLAYKASAKKEIKDYAQSLNLTTDYSSLLENANNSIDNASTKEEIDKIVDETKKALDDMKISKINKKKEEAINTINEYKKDDEEFISDITTTKEEAINNINDEETNTLEEIESIVEDTISKIDDLVNNTEFSVNFYDFNKKLIDSQKVKYTKDATEPSVDEVVKTFNNTVVNKFNKWSTSFTNVKTNLDVYAIYDVDSAIAKVVLLEDEEEIILKNNASIILNDAFVSLINNYSEDVVVANENVKALVSDELPSIYNNNKYMIINYYSLVLTKYGFVVNAKIDYDYASELNDEIDKAINDIKNYKKEDEKYISEVTTAKNEIIAELDALRENGTIEEVAKVVKDGKQRIDDIINRKTFKVTFVGMNGVKEVQNVKYNKNAKAPNSKNFTEPTYKNVEYKLSGWDKDYKKVTSNLTVNATYRIHKIYANVVVSGVNLKNSKIELKDNVTKTLENVITNDVDALVFTTDSAIRSVDKSNKLPKKDGKYKEYTFNELKFTSEGFVISGTLFYDKDLEELDNLKAELQRLINAAKNLNTTNKTTASINKLNADIAKAENNVKGNDVAKIKESINDLKNINLVDIVISLNVVNNKKTYIQGQKFDLTVTYSDNNGNIDQSAEGYKILVKNVATDKDTVVGNKKSATVEYKGATKTFEYNVIEKVITSISVTNNKAKYFRNENADITVKATYNDNDVKTIDASYYTITDFKNDKKVNNKRAKVTLNSNKSIYDYFNYSVDSKTYEEYIDKINNDKLDKVKIYLHDGKIEFKNLTSDVNNINVIKVYTIIGIEYDSVQIPLIPTANPTIFALSEENYEKLIHTNTLPAGQYIKIIYSISGREYTRKYYEFVNYVF